MTAAQRTVAVASALLCLSFLSITLADKDPIVHDPRKTTVDMSDWRDEYQAPTERLPQGTPTSP